MDIQTKVAFDLFIEWYNKSAPIVKCQVCKSFLMNDGDESVLPRPKMPHDFATGFLVAMWEHINWQEIETEFVNKIKSGIIKDMSTLFIKRTEA